MRTLDFAALTEVRQALTARLTAGLNADQQEILALCAHFPPPPPHLTGDALVVDIGGTNARAAWVRLGDTPQLIAGPISQKLALRDQAVSRAAFFDLQAHLAAQLGAPKNLPVGYCFSYPSEVTPQRDAKLLAWTKDMDLPEVVGTYVGSGLADALVRAGFSPPRVHVLNDTVAAMLAGTTLIDDPRQVIGLIVGTGTNLSGFFDGAPKLRHLPSPMAVNLESGYFFPPHLDPADDRLDAASNNPGRQRFEKAVSGYYLPYLYQDLSGQPSFDPTQGSGALVKLRAQGDPIAAQLLSRSADLVAAALAGVIDLYPPGKVGILAEGSLFWRDPEYAPRVTQTLTALVGDRFSILHQNDANLFGAACAALMP